MKGERYAILIGCNRYDHLEQLRCPVNDVKALAPLLTNQEIGAFSSVTCFTDGEGSSDILAKTEEVLTDKANNEDAFLVYYSGHGKLDKNGRLYLSTKATNEKALDATSLAIDRIIRYVERSRCHSILLVLDCCFSGAVKGALVKGGIDDAIVAATHGKGLFILTSSTETQQSHEKEGDTCSIFTKFLVEGLETGQADLNNDGYISFVDAQKYTYNCVRGTGLQTPVHFVMGAEGDFVLAKNRHYKPVKILDPSGLSSADFKKFYAVKTVIETLGTRDPPIYMIMFVPGRGYSIEGFRYGASALTVSNDHTPNMRLTEDGFECDSFFKPEMIHTATRMGKEIINEVIKVRMHVSFSDIWMIVGRLKGGKGEEVTIYEGKLG